MPLYIFIRREKMLSRRELLEYSAVMALGFDGLSFGKKPSFERLLDTKPYGNVSLVFTSDQRL